MPWLTWLSPASWECKSRKSPYKQSLRLTALLPIRKSSIPEITPLSEADALEAARLKFEAEKMTRRAALRKLGITSGMAFFSLFAVDDLARMAIKKMRQNEATRDIAETVAREFKDAGIAFADDPPITTGGCLPGNAVIVGCAGADIGANCLCCPTAAGSVAACIQQACLRRYPNGLSTWPWDYAQFAAYNDCINQDKAQRVRGQAYICAASAAS